MSEDVAEKLMPKFSRLSIEYQQEIIPISNGTVEQLHELVQLVSSKTVSKNSNWLTVRLSLAN